MLEQLPSIQFPPLEIGQFRQTPGKGRDRPDGLLALRWRGAEYDFAVKCSPLATPKAMEELLRVAGRDASSGKRARLIVVPFLSEEQLRRLEADGISGLDLCGNGVIVVPDRLLVVRTGQPNRYPQSSPIRNVYRGTSSVVARVFLLRKEFGKVSEIRREIAERGGAVSLATISKVLTRLEEDLMVSKGRRTGAGVAIRVLQPDKLIEKLLDHYESPRIRRRFVGKWAGGRDELPGRMAEVAGRGRAAVVRTGAASTAAYAVMGREDVISFYCPDVAAVVDSLGERVQETSRFPDFELLETPEAPPYFDARADLMASPIQTYLELARGDRREAETAEQVKRRILADLEAGAGGA